MTYCLDLERATCIAHEDRKRQSQRAPGDTGKDLRGSGQDRRRVLARARGSRDERRGKGFRLHGRARRVHGAGHGTRDARARASADRRPRAGTGSRVGAHGAQGFVDRPGRHAAPGDRAARHRALGCSRQDRRAAALPPARRLSRPPARLWERRLLVQPDLRAARGKRPRLRGAGLYGDQAAARAREEPRARRCAV